MTPARTLLPTSHKSFAGSTLAALLISSLAGCSGGGDDDAPNPAHSTEPPPAHVTQPLSETPASSYSGRQLEAYLRLNEARLAAGVGAVRQNAQLDAAAQAHSLYLTKNFVLGHGEDPAQPYFTGKDSRARARAQGYGGQTVTELVSYFLSSGNGATHVDAYLRSVYHMHGALDPRANQLGMGWSPTAEPGPYSASTFSLGSTESTLLPFAKTWVWPAPGTTEIPPDFAPTSEIPNPMPDVGSAMVGTPIMFCGANGNYASLDISSITLGSAEGVASVELRILHHPDTRIVSPPGIDARVDSNIANLYSQSMRSCIFVIPMSALMPGTQYTVGVEGTQNGVAISKSWSFETAK